MAKALTPIDLFATRIWLVDLSHLSNHYDKWRDYIKLAKETSPMPLGRSNRMGWNSKPILFNDPIFFPLRDQVFDCVSAVFNQMLPNNQILFKLEAWANQLEPGGFNTFHLHPGALLSACFYLTVPPDSSPLVLRDPRAGVALSPFTGGGPNCNQYLHVDPKEGSLILFPNWLEHSVEPNHTTQLRESIPINAFLDSH